jgi:hypothetical protein
MFTTFYAETARARRADFYDNDFIKKKTRRPRTPDSESSIAVFFAHVCVLDGSESGSGVAIVLSCTRRGSLQKLTIACTKLYQKRRLNACCEMWGGDIVLSVAGYGQGVSGVSLSSQHEFFFFKITCLAKREKKSRREERDQVVSRNEREKSSREAREKSRLAKRERKVVSRSDREKASREATEKSRLAKKNC